jgi:hypothetical protein
MRAAVPVPPHDVDQAVTAVADAPQQPEDPERSLRGAALNHHNIQIGIGRALIREYADDWVVGLADITPTVHTIAAPIRSDQSGRTQRLLPAERRYPLDRAVAHRIHADA